MKEYHTTPSNKKYGIDNLPTEEMRLYDEEIKSAVEYERESMTASKEKKAPTGEQLSTSSSQDDQEFPFENARANKHNSNGSKLSEGST